MVIMSVASMISANLAVAQICKISFKTLPITTNLKIILPVNICPIALKKVIDTHTQTRKP
jgi:hypothetical protein